MKSALNIEACRVRKLFRFSFDDSSCVQIDFRLLNEVPAYKTVECFDESVSKDVTVFCNSLWLQAFGSREELGCLAQQLSQLVRGEQLVLRIFLINNIMDHVVDALTIMLCQRHAEKPPASLNVCFHWKLQPFFACNHK